MQIQFDERAVEALRNTLFASNPDTRLAKEIIADFFIRENHHTVGSENLTNLIDFRLIRERKAFKAALEHAALKSTA